MTEIAQDYMAKAASRYQRYQTDRWGAITAYLEAGAALNVARSLAAHGEWAVLLAESSIPERTARRMMRLATHYEDATAVIEAGGIRASLEAMSEAKMDTVSEIQSNADLESIPQSDTTPIASPEEMADALDGLESENYELRHENAALKDEVEAKDQAPPKPQRLSQSKIEALQDENWALREKQEELRQRVQDLEDEVRFLKGELAPVDATRQAYFSNQLAHISHIDHARWEIQAKYNELLGSQRYWRDWAKKNGWTDAEIKTQKQGSAASGEHEVMEAPRRDGYWHDRTNIPPTGHEDTEKATAQREAAIHSIRKPLGAVVEEPEAPFDMPPDEYDDDPFGDEDPSDEWAASIVETPYAPGDMLQTLDGEIVQYQGQHDDGGAMVVTEAGLGRATSVPWQNLAVGGGR